MSENTALIKNTKFESLVKKMKTDVHNRKRDEMKRILSVSWFLKRACGITAYELSFEDFKVVEEEMRKTAQAEIGKPWYKKFFRFIKVGAWRDYLELGHFDCEFSPFGNWLEKHPFAPYQYDSFIPEKYLDKAGTGLFPKNLRELMNEILEKEEKQENANANSAA